MKVRCPRDIGISEAYEGLKDTLPELIPAEPSTFPFWGSECLGLTGLPELSPLS